MPRSITVDNHLITHPCILKTTEWPFCTHLQLPEGAKKQWRSWVFVARGVQVLSRGSSGSARSFYSGAVVQGIWGVEVPSASGVHPPKANDAYFPFPPSLFRILFIYFTNINVFCDFVSVFATNGAMGGRTGLLELGRRGSERKG